MTLVKYFVLMFFSNVFMTMAWYGHLKHKDKALWFVIVTSWLIAFFEYCLQVPATRMGSSVFTTAQMKTLQEVITMVVFAGFSIWYLGEPIKWNYIAASACLVLAAFFMFQK